MRRAGSNRLLIMLTLVALIPFSLPTLLVMFVGMMPTLGAALSDRSGSRYCWLCVGGLNFAGLANWLLFLWFGHHDISSAIQMLLGDHLMLMVAYGAAGIGWLLYMAVPPVVAAIQTGTTHRRAANLASQQKKLVELWGDEIRRASVPEIS
jgi:hypothetical protein